MELERWQDQVVPLNAVPLADDAAVLVELLNDLDELPDRFAAFKRAYLQGDAGRALALGPPAWTMPEPSSKDYAVFIQARNEAWWPELKARLDAGDVFAAVGFAHLVGPQGLISALTAAGYEVTQIHTSQPGHSL